MPTLPLDSGLPTAITDGATILAGAFVPLDAEATFDALVSATAEEWWGSADTYRITDWRFDPRPGGRWSVVVRGADGSQRPASGVFLEIARPARVVFTRKYEWDYPLLGRRDTIVTYRFDSAPGGVRVTVRHDGFESAGPAAHEHVEGWVRVLQWLIEYANAVSAKRREASPQTFTPDDGVDAIVALVGARLTDASRPFAMMVDMEMRPNCAAVAAEAFTRARAPTLAEDSPLAFEFLREHGGLQRFVAYEAWRNLQDFDAHLRTPHASALRQAFNDLVVGLPEIRVYEPLSG